jgi:hypothetical protein
MSRSTVRNIRCIVYVILPYINRRDVERHCPTKPQNIFLTSLTLVFVRANAKFIGGSAGIRARLVSYFLCLCDTCNILVGIIIPSLVSLPTLLFTR